MECSAIASIGFTVISIHKVKSTNVTVEALRKFLGLLPVSHIEQAAEIDIDKDGIISLIDLQVKKSTTLTQIDVSELVQVPASEKRVPSGEMLRAEIRSDPQTNPQGPCREGTELHRTFQVH